MKVNKRNVSFSRADPLTIDSRSSPPRAMIIEAFSSPTQGHDFRPSTEFRSPDSGFEDSHSSEYTPIRETWNKTYILLSGKKKSLFDHQVIKGSPWPYMRPIEMVPFCMLLLLFGTAIITICTINNAMSRNVSRSAKYVGVLPKMKLVDENGIMLGGKKASIQFAYNQWQEVIEDESIDSEEETVLANDGIEVAKSKIKEENELKIEPSNEMLKKITLETVNSVMKILDEQKAKDKEREVLLKKLSEFGHFGTSVVKPLELDESPNDTEDSDAIKEEKLQPSKDGKKKRKKRNGLSPKKEPFRFNQESPVKDDFRVTE